MRIIEIKEETKLIQRGKIIILEKGDKISITRHKEKEKELKEDSLSVNEGIDLLLKVSPLIESVFFEIGPKGFINGKVYKKNKTYFSIDSLYKVFDINFQYVEQYFKLNLFMTEIAVPYFETKAGVEYLKKLEFIGNKKDYYVTINFVDGIPRG